LSQLDFLDRSVSANYNATGGIRGKLPDTKVTVALETLGCKLNQAESEQMARELAESGCEITRSLAEADIYILNTCTVTHIADRKVRHLIRMAHRRNPRARIVVLGCYAERSAATLSRIEGIDIVAGHEAKNNLPKLLKEKGMIAPLMKAGSIHLARTRSFIKVQDGCNQYCSYCIVPVVRGREWSVPPEQVIDEIRKRIADGYREVVLTGTEIGRYRDGGVDLRGLVEGILKFTSIERLRLSSLQPQELNSELVRLWQDPRLCRHFHLSLQSGSNTVLERMNRRYTALGFSQTVSLIRSEIPDVAISTDIIVGFPGETEAEFQQSYDFCHEMQFSRIHVFSYSAREGTAAAKIKNPVSSPVKKQRSDIMLGLARSSMQNRRKNYLGSNKTILVEKGSDGVYSGLTDNYIKVFFKSDVDLVNKLVSAKLIALYKDGIWGDVDPDT